MGRGERDRELERENMMHAMIISENGGGERKESGSENDNMATIAAEENGRGTRTGR